MQGLFKVGYFDPKRGASNQHAVRVIAANAEDAIRKADRQKLMKYYRVEEVICIGWTDE